MSSTNRSKKRDDHKYDYYVTPEWGIREFVHAWERDERIFTSLLGRRTLTLDQPLIVDPCAGGDKNAPMMYPTVINKMTGLDVSSIDIRIDSHAEVIGNFLEYTPSTFPWEPPELIISNPPFNLATEFVNKALELVAPGGFVVFLLRLTFFGSQGRNEFFQKHMPRWHYIHSKRMSFTDDGKTDSVEYMHAIWQKGYNPTSSEARIIPLVENDIEWLSNIS